MLLLQVRQLALSKLQKKHEALVLKGRGQDGGCCCPCASRGIWSTPSQQPWLLHVPLLSQCVVQPDLFGLPHVGEEAHSQAYYIIKAAQERQELTEQVGSCVAAQPEARRGSSPAVSFMDSCSSCALLSFRLRVATHWTLHSALPLLDRCAVHLFQL